MAKTPKPLRRWQNLLYATVRRRGHGEAARLAVNRIIAKGVRRRAVEAVCGLPVGTVLALAEGRAHPSRLLASLLVLMADDPKRRLAEIEHGWNHGPGIMEAGSGVG